MHRGYGESVKDVYVILYHHYSRMAAEREKKLEGREKSDIFFFFRKPHRVIIT